MNHSRVVLAAALFLGVTSFTYAQEQEAPKTSRQEGSRRDVGAPRQEESKPQKPEKQDETKPQKPEKSENPQMPQESSKPGHKEKEKGQQGQQEHARPAGKSAHIPDQKFKASFGSEHKFAVRQVINTTTVTPGQTQFVYSGYTFVILDPWPAEWAFTDSCYIDYLDDEYFLFDAFHPGIRIALFVEG